jgi:hypothetical protein
MRDIIQPKSPDSTLAAVPLWPYRAGMNPILRTILAAIPPDADRRRVAVTLINAGLFLLRDQPASDPASGIPRNGEKIIQVTEKRRH